MQLLASGKWFSKAVTTAPQIQTLGGTNPRIIVILAAPVTSACPEVKAFRRSLLSARKVRMDEFRFSRDADSVFSLGNMRAGALRAWPAITGDKLERIDQRVGSRFLLAASALKPRLLRAAYGGLREHWVPAFNHQRFKRPIFSDCELQFDLTTDVRLLGQPRVSWTGEAHNTNAISGARVGLRVRCIRGDD